jgi:hypothetical protein
MRDAEIEFHVIPEVLRQGWRYRDTHIFANCVEVTANNGVGIFGRKLSLARRSDMCEFAREIIPSFL